jgi:hypothetical protein
MQFPPQNYSPTISIGFVGSNHSSPSNFDPVSSYLSSFKIQPHSTKSSAALPAQRFDTHNLHSFRSNELNNLLTSTDLNVSYDPSNRLNVKPLDKSPQRRFSVQPPIFTGFSSFDEKSSPVLYQPTNYLSGLSLPRSEKSKQETSLNNTYLSRDLLSSYSQPTSILNITSLNLSPRYNITTEPITTQNIPNTKYQLGFLTGLAKKFKESTHANNEDIIKTISSAKKPGNMFMEERSPLRKLNLYGMGKDIDLMAKVDQINEYTKKIY